MEAIVATEAEQKQTPAWLLELYGGEPDNYQTVELAGVEWWCWHGCTRQEINCHIKEDGGRLRMVKCSQGDKGVFVWGFSLLVADGQYICAYGEAETLLQAAEAALAYVPEELDFGGMAWFRGQGEAEQWEGWVNGDRVRIHAVNETCRWERKCAEAENLLEFCDSFGSGLSGKTATREEAMQAAIDAPNKLRELASKFVIGKLVEEAYVRGVTDGREEMRSAIKSMLNYVRLLPAGKPKAKAA